MGETFADISAALRRAGGAGGGGGAEKESGGAGKERIERREKKTERHIGPVQVSGELYARSVFCGTIL